MRVLGTFVGACVVGGGAALAGGAGAGIGIGIGIGTGPAVVATRSHGFMEGPDE